MTLATKADLETAIGRYLRRASIADMFPDFIALCETDMQRRLEVADLELSTTLTTTASNPSVTLPTGFTSMRRLRVFYNNYYHDMEAVALDPSDSQNWSITGFPNQYSVIGSSLSLRPVPNDAYTLYLDYYGKFTPLSTAASTNWILTNNPDAYLFGSLLQSAPYLGTDNRLELWQAGYNSAIEGINEADYKKRFKNLIRQTEIAALVNRRPFNIYRGR